MFRRGHPDAAARSIAGAARVRVTRADGIRAALEATAIATARVGSPCRARVLDVVDGLLAQPNTYGAAMSFLEDVQNATSHLRPDLCTDQDIRAELGPRARIAWQSLTRFWEDVWDWSGRQSDLPDAPSPQDIAGVSDQQLRDHVLTAFRRVDENRCIGYGHAAIYEWRGLGGLPGIAHIDALL